MFHFVFHHFSKIVMIWHNLNHLAPFTSATQDYKYIQSDMDTYQDGNLPLVHMHF